MAQEIEIEFKNLVTQDEFSHLISHFHINDEDFTSQDNHYFDTPDYQLKDNQSALRIRHKSGTYTLTLKTPLKEDLLETNQQLSKQEADSLLSGDVFPEGEVKSAIHSLTISINPFNTSGHSRRAELKSIIEKDFLFSIKALTYKDKTMSLSMK